MIANAFAAVFGNWRYSLLAWFVALLVFVLATWLPNLGLLVSVVSNSSVPMSDKVSFALNLVDSITTNFTALSATYTVTIALLTGVNVALVVYLMVRNKRSAIEGGATGVLGVMSGTLGVGCAACGSLILTSVLGTAGGTGIITILPFHGGEFGILGVALSTIATYLLAKNIGKPPVCAI